MAVDFSRLLRCGRKLKVLHHSRRAARYVCATHVDRSTEKRCTVFSNMRIDAAVSAEVLRAIAPLALEAAHARRQYDAVEPDNRLVAGELERRWNDSLAAVARLEDQVRSLRSGASRPRRNPNLALRFGDDPLGRHARFLQQPDQQSLGSLGIASALNDLVENITVLVNGTPKPVLAASDRDRHLVQMPDVPVRRPPPTVCFA